MRISKIIFFALLLGIFGSACNKGSNNSQPEMYEDSELAQLMRVMHEEQLAIKEAVLKGEDPKSFPESYTKMTTSEATENMEIGEAYKAYAALHNMSMEKLAASESADLAENHNLVIRSCVNCHQDHCTGPIEKIEKLYIR